ncbi:hypothetical protein [Nostoc sp.]
MGAFFGAGVADAETGIRHPPDHQPLRITLVDLQELPPLYTRLVAVSLSLGLFGAIAPKQLLVK